MTSSLPPHVLLILGALVVPFLRGRARSVALLALPVASFVLLLGFDKGSSVQFAAFGRELTLMRVDQLSLVWAYVFHIALFVGLLYALHVRSAAQHVAALVYGASALGAVLAGDLISFWCWWEVMAVSSTFLVLARRRAKSTGAAMRALMVQLVSGLLLLIGIVLHVHQTGSIAFDRMTPAGGGSIFDLAWSGAGTVLILLGLGIKCGWPLVHGWITDSYPEATPTGTVFLSAFTTKTAVYALARAFPGAEELIYIGTAMAVFPLIYTAIENDVRRVLTYAMINKLGFMVVGVGIGTDLAISAVAALAFCHILYKSLLFMTTGAVLFRTGRGLCTELGGLHRTMPWTTGFCLVGGASISGPLFCGFVAKALIMVAVAKAGYATIWVLLLCAAAGVFVFTGIKIPFFMFFARDSGLRPKEAPRNMLLAMGLASAACIGIGIFPDLLYRHLPYAIPDYAMPYTAAHVIQQLQLLVLAALAFCALMRTGVYPPELRAVNLDADVWYRKGAPLFVRFVSGPLMTAFGWIGTFFHERVPNALIYFSKNPSGAMKLGYDRVLLAWAGLFGQPHQMDYARARLETDQARYRDTRASSTWPIGTTVLYMSLVFFLYLIIYLWRD
ncbi:MAG: Na(+)/H(+) antiporter subunit D [Planctomycetota bacterium]|nr:Na(+)/H(+) antiporter subunit D [Planctomycetota bacterium]